MNMVLHDYFSGIGGFHLGLQNAGLKFSDVYYSEIDKHAIANYKNNFKDAKYIGDVKSILSADTRRPNIITFGSPCQDFSLAGKRKGLGGARSSLIEYALRAISKFRPDVFIWENVKGAFSSNNSEDFWAIIQAFTNIGGYRLEWQLLNTSWVLPQNRERIYLVGHLADTFRNWGGVFPVRENDFSSEKLFRKKRFGLQPKVSTTITTRYGNVPSDTYVAQKGRGYIKSGLSKVCPTISMSSFEHNTAVVQVKSANNRGYEIANPGDSINLQFPNSKTRRGRVGRRVSQTLDCACNQGVYQDRAIRRLTEIECERLQGFPDDWTKYGVYDDKEKEIAKTNRYKLIGNAVTVDVVELVGKRILNNYKLK